MILVTGATGTIGREVVAQLVAAGQKPRVLVRSPEKLKHLEGKIEVVKGDLDDAASLAKAMQGCDKLFLLTAGVDGPRLEAKAIDAAKAAGIKHVVKLSVLGAEFEAVSFGKWHRASEKKLEASGLQWTFIRPGNFMTNTLMWSDTIKKDGAIYQPVGNGKYASIDPADIAAVAVKALTADGHAGKAYALTGPESMSTQQMADVLGKALGKPVKHVDVPADAARSGMIAAGLPEGYVNALMELMAVMKAGGTDLVTPVFQELMGRKPTSFDQWVANNVGAFR
jgi:uncharacterized protein YbjT (DUF2867 family)